MTIPTVKAMVAKVMTVGFLAGALTLAGSAKAQAQAFGVGVQFGGPRVGFAGPGYVAPGYGGPVYGGQGFYARRAWEQEQFARRQALVRHEEWERAHRFGRPFGFSGYYGR